MRTPKSPFHRIRILVLPLAFTALAFSLPARAQDGGLRDELKKLIDAGRKNLVEELDKAFAARTERFLEAMMKTVEERVGARVSKLEADLKARDKKIEELEAQVKKLSASQSAPAPPPAPPKPSGAFLGVGHTDVPAESRTKLKIEGGALVTQVVEESPAAAAGLQVGDVIVDLNGTAVSSANLSSAVGAFKADQEINVTFLRDGNRTTKSLKLVEKDKFFAALEAKRAKPAEPPKKEPIVLGVTVKEDGSTLIVENVEDGLTGSVAGLKAGDKVTHFNGKELKSIEDIAGEVKKVLEGDTFKVVFVRGDETVTVTAVGAKGKEGAKLVAREAQKPKPKEEPKPEPKPEPKEAKPGVLGVAVVIDVPGVVVDSVLPETAAAAAGLKKGDVIVKANGHDIGEVEQLRGILSKLSAGDKVSLQVLRDGQTVEVKDIALKAEGEKATAAAAPEKPKEEPKPAAQPAAAPAPQPKKKGALGILATQGTDGKVSVKVVNPGGPAEKGELKAGDIILKINDKAVVGFDDLANVLQALFAGDSVTLRVKRGADEKDLKITLGEAG